MTQPESRTVEERLAAALFHLRDVEDLPDSSASDEFVAQRLIAAAKEHGLVIGEGELDRAWKEAEAALPKDWRSRFTFQRGSDDEPLSRIWHVVAEDVDDQRLGYLGSGLTPAAALYALAERLRR